MNLIEIAKSWYNFVNQTPELKELAEQRLAICDTCPDKEQMSPAGQLILNTINEESSSFRCGLCKCPLSGKVFSNGKCPAGKW